MRYTDEATRMRHIPELERMKSLNYQEGKSFLATNPYSSSLLDRLATDCPHVERRDLVSLFHLRNEEVIAAAAHRLEYNATHPPGAPGSDLPGEP